MSKVWDYKSNETDKLAEKVAKDASIVMTKPEMAKDLLALIKFKKGDSVIEPARGDSAFYDSFPKYVKKEWCEINEGRDYLEFTGEVDYTISNPPFVPRKLFWSFQQKAMETTRKEIYWLINMSSLNVFTPKRLEEMKELGWYINGLHIVGDKRWYGRYCFIKINKKKSDIITFSRINY